MATGQIQNVQIDPKPEFADILKPQINYAQPTEQERFGSKIDGWFDRLMIQSGMPITPMVALMLCLLGALAIGGLVFVIQENFLTAGIATLIGFIIPIGILMVVRSNRQNKIVSQLPGMIDELARAAKTGRSLENCVGFVSEETPAPLGSELRLCARKLKMGVTINEALYALPERTGVDSLRILATALSVHQQTGGDLVRVLERLSRTIRDRQLYLGRLKAATAASRATAILMVILPPGVLAYFSFQDPNYLNDLLGSSGGRAVTLTGLMLTTIGALWTMRILSDSKKT